MLLSPIFPLIQTQFIAKDRLILYFFAHLDFDLGNIPTIIMPFPFEVIKNKIYH
jgi:hypothetical protein